MEYVKGNPYFFLNSDKIKKYPYLNVDINCDILIIGGGINGAILNYFLSKNYDVMLVDKSRIGASCTSCATALLEYQLDDYAFDLTDYFSEDQIVDVYKMGLYSIDKIEKFIKENGNECFFAKRPTLIYSDKILKSKNVEKEYEFRIKNGFDCKLITEKNNPFQFKIKKGIYCNNGGCELDPYLFTKQLIENSLNQNRIFENTKVEKIESKNDICYAYTNFGEKITCKKIIITTGFNWEFINKNDLCERFVSYTIVTNKLKNFSWHKKTLIQDDNSPYHYLRTLPDGRIIYGGEDTLFNNQEIENGVAEKKYKILKQNLLKLFPELENKLKIDYKFCGFFGATDDNLGLIGKTTEKNILYFLSCGANGIINAMYGVEIVNDILQNKKNKLEALFSPLRFTKK